MRPCITIALFGGASPSLTGHVRLRGPHTAAAIVQVCDRQRRTVASEEMYEVNFNSIYNGFSPKYMYLVLCSANFATERAHTFHPSIHRKRLANNTPAPTKKNASPVVDVHSLAFWGIRRPRCRLRQLDHQLSESDQWRRWRSLQSLHLRRSGRRTSLLSRRMCALLKSFPGCKFNLLVGHVRFEGRATADFDSLAPFSSRYVILTLPN